MWSLFLCLGQVDMQTLIGTKKSQSQKFLENGTRIPVTLIDIKNNWVVSHKTLELDKYQAVQLGFSMKKSGNKAEVGHAKGAKQEKAPKFLKEVRILADESLPEMGSVLNPVEILQPGDIVNVTGTSKGKGYAGVVKRHGFHGGPKTHGQSDRHRAPGAIGQGTTPGRVYKGKRMAGRMGDENVTVRNLEVMDVTQDTLTLKGLVPGIKNGLIIIKKMGEGKKFTPLWQEKIQAEVPSDQASKEPTSDVPAAEEESAPAATQQPAPEETPTPAQEAPASQEEVQPVQEATPEAESVESKGGSDNANS